MTEWSDHKVYVSDIRLALKTGQRPTATILRDKYAGYRDYGNPLWEYERGPYVNTSEWTTWDYALASTLQLIEDYTDKSTGQLYWYDQSDKVEWEVKSMFSGSQAALDREKDRDLEPGETLYAEPVFRNPEDRPTINEWLEDLANDTLHPQGSPNTGHEGLEVLDARDIAAKRRAEILADLTKSPTATMDTD